MPEKQPPESEITKGEQKLSPEVIERIMAKVQDVDKEETAYHFVDFTSSPDRGIEGLLFTRTLQEGLIAEGRYKPSLRDKTFGQKRRLLKNKGVVIVDDKTGIRIELAENVDRDEKTRPIPERVPAIYFHIVGRKDLRRREGETVLSHARYLNEKGLKNIEGDRIAVSDEKDSTAILFDTSSFKEGDVPVAEEDELPKKPRTFYALTKSVARDRKERIIPTSEEGFILPYRVPPRFFRGVVFKLRKEISDTYLDPKEARDFPSYRYIEEDNQTKLQEHASQIAQRQLEVSRDKPQSLLPIYDVNGNLYWPKQMSYEEVKAFIVERDAEKVKSEKK